MRATTAKRIREMASTFSMAYPQKARARVYLKWAKKLKADHGNNRRPAPPPIVAISKKQHPGEPLDKFRKRRRISNTIRREREKQFFN